MTPTSFTQRHSTCLGLGTHRMEAIPMDEGRDHED